MRPISTVLLIAALAANFALVGPAAAKPSAKTSARSAPEAADQTLGMALMGAAVRANGTLYEGVGVVSATRATTGAYRVTFARSIQGCLLNPSATLLPGDSSGGAFAAASYFGEDTVAITMRNPSGAIIDHSVQLMVFCAK